MTEANQGVAPPDFTTSIGQVRLLMGDTDPTILPSPAIGQGVYKFYSDNEITALLSLYDDNPRSAAARILRTVAVSQVLLLKAFTSADLQVNGPAIADALRLLADKLDTEVTEGAVDFVNVVPTGGLAWSAFGMRGRTDFPSPDDYVPYPLTALELGELQTYYPVI